MPPRIAEPEADSNPASQRIEPLAQNLSESGVCWVRPSGRRIIRQPQPTMSLSPGTRLGSYEVTALIGQGGMGEVWRNRVIKTIGAFATVG